MHASMQLLFGFLSSYIDVVLLARTMHDASHSDWRSVGLLAQIICDCIAEKRDARHPCSVTFFLEIVISLEGKRFAFPC